MNQSFFSQSFHFFEILRQSYHYADNRDGSPEHYLALMLDGRCRIVSRDGSIEAAKGDVFYIPKGLPYQSYWYGSPHVRFISLGFSLFPDAEHTAHPLQIITCSEDAKSAFLSIPTGAVPDCAALGQFYTLLGNLLPQMTTAPTNKAHRLFREAYHLFYEQPNQTAAQVARQLDISESALYAVFKQVGHTTPNLVRREILCEKAVFLLSTTNRSVQDISDSLGFSSASYFRKVLRAHVGMTPRAIRKTNVSV